MYFKNVAKNELKEYLTIDSFIENVIKWFINIKIVILGKYVF
jgi:hypothetical protein